MSEEWTSDRVSSFTKSLNGVDQKYGNKTDYGYAADVDGKTVKVSAGAYVGMGMGDKVDAAIDSYNKYSPKKVEGGVTDVVANDGRVYFYNADTGDYVSTGLTDNMSFDTGNVKAAKTDAYYKVDAATKETTKETAEEAKEEDKEYQAESQATSEESKKAKEEQEKAEKKAAKEAEKQKKKEEKEQKQKEKQQKKEQEKAEKEAAKKVAEEKKKQAAAVKAQEEAAKAEAEEKKKAEEEAAAKKEAEENAKKASASCEDVKEFDNYESRQTYFKAQKDGYSGTFEIDGNDAALGRNAQALATDDNNVLQSYVSDYESYCPDKLDKVTDVFLYNCTTPPSILYYDKDTGDYILQSTEEGNLSFKKGNFDKDFRQYTYNTQVAAAKERAAKAEEERQAKIAAEKKAQKEAAAKERAKAEAKAETERKQKEKEAAEAEEKAKKEAEEKRKEAEKKATEEENGQKQAEAKKKAEEEEKAAKEKAEAERKAAEEKAKQEEAAAKEAAAQKEAEANENIDDKAEAAVDEKEEKNDEALAKVDEIEKKEELQKNIEEEKAQSKANDEDIEAVKNSSNSKQINASNKSKEASGKSNSFSAVGGRWYASTEGWPVSSKYFVGSPFEKMIFAGTDFMKQNFDLGFVFYNENDKNIVSGNWDEIVTMWTRTSSVEVPRLKAKTFNLKLPIGSVEKISSKFEGQYETTLNLRLDENLQVVDFFNNLSSNNEFYQAPDEDNRDVYVKLYPASAVYAKANLMNKQSRIDIIVKHSNSMFTNSSQSSKVDLLDFRKTRQRSGDIIDYANAPLPGNKTMLWAFEDINVIGVMNGVQFSNSGEGPQTVPIKFTYKRLARIIRDSTN